VNLTVHEVVRDWPETLELFQESGISLVTEGGTNLGEVSAGEESLVEKILSATAWRAPAP
jgi:hypothetical protein